MVDAPTPEATPPVVVVMGDTGLAAQNLLTADQRRL
jgi:hypothetical protein